MNLPHHQSIITELTNVDVSNGSLLVQRVQGQEVLNRGSNLQVLDVLSGGIELLQ